MPPSPDDPFPRSGFLAVVADDLTGAADTGAAFLPAFPSTLLLIGGVPEALPAHPRPGAVSVSVNSRHADPVEAADKVRRTAAALVRFSPALWYKKIDSILRGNPGAEADAMLEALDRELCFVAPAFPSMGRNTESDVHRVHGIPVDQTEAARDPRSPVRESRLSRRIAEQSRHSVGHVDLETLRTSPTAAKKRIEALRTAGLRHIAFDATESRDLDRIAALLRWDYPDAIPVGSAGLAAALARSFQKSNLQSEAVLAHQRGFPPQPNEIVDKTKMAGNTQFPGNPVHPGKLPGTRSEAVPADAIAQFDRPVQKILFVRGSASAVLARQIDRLREQFGIPVIEFPAAVLAAPEAEPPDPGQIQEMKEHWETGFRLGIAPAASTETETNAPEQSQGMAADWKTVFTHGIGQMAPSKTEVLGLEPVQRMAENWETGLVLGIAPPSPADPSSSPDPAADPDGLVWGLAAWAAELIHIGRPDGLFLSGGDTAEAVLSRLQADGIWLRGESVPGVIAGEISGGPLSGLRVWTKAGAFGSPETLVHLYGNLSKKRES